MRFLGMLLRHIAVAEDALHWSEILGGVHCGLPTGTWDKPLPKSPESESVKSHRVAQGAPPWRGHRPPGSNGCLGSLHCVPSRSQTSIERRRTCSRKMLTKKASEGDCE